MLSRLSGGTPPASSLTSIFPILLQPFQSKWLISPLHSGPVSVELSQARELRLLTPSFDHVEMHGCLMASGIAKIVFEDISIIGSQSLVFGSNLVTCLLEILIWELSRIGSFWRLNGSFWRLFFSIMIVNKGDFNWNRRKNNTGKVGCVLCKK